MSKNHHRVGSERIFEPNGDGDPETNKLKGLVKVVRKVPEVFVLAPEDSALYLVRNLNTGQELYAFGDELTKP